MFWNYFTILLVQKVNTWTSLINSPPNVKRKKRRVLVIQCHPLPDSLNAQAADAVCRGLLKAEHTVRLRRLYFYEGDHVKVPIPDATRLSVESYGNAVSLTLSPSLTASERAIYHSLEHTTNREYEHELAVSVPVDVKGAVKDILWCDSIVFVYPTWWFNFPAALKGYFDRVLLPGIAFKLPQSNVSAVGSTGLVPQLTHINKVGVVTTFGASRLVVAYAGDNGRRFISRGFRALCAPGCQMTWHGLHSATVCNDHARQSFLAEVEQDYSQF